jgi:predicted DCC family thiol-disulfide oxidoreductase YuxK
MHLKKSSATHPEKNIICFKFNFAAMPEDINNSSSSANATGTGGIILFDGVCNYCNAMVNFVLKRDRKDRFLFAPLQSDKGQELRKKYNIADSIDSFIYIEKDNANIYSTGALKVCRHLSGAWPALYALIIVPVFIRDGIYKWVARNRYKWFGKKETCMIPTPEVRRKFLL